MKKYYFFLAFLFYASYSKAQFSVVAAATNSNVCLGNTSTLTATASPIGYTLSSITTAPASPQGINVLVDNGSVVTTQSAGINMNDARWDNISIPFSFRFYGNLYNALSISTNGWVGFSSYSTTTGFNGTIPNAAAPNNLIHAITSDLTFAGVGSFSTLEYFQDGVPPNRRFIVNYGDAQFSSSAGVANVQVILYETTNVVEIHTTNCTNTTLLKVQGIENSTGTIGTAATGRNYVANWGITSGSPSYRFTPDNVTYTWSPGATLNTTTGGSVIATPTANTTYSVTALNTVSGLSATNTVAVNINAVSYTLAGIAGAGQVCQNIDVRPSGTYYREGTCKLIATITPSGAFPITNTVNTCILVETGAKKFGSSELYVARKYDIEPQVNPSTSTATLTLYYLQSEFNNFNTKASDSGHYALPTASGDATGISNLRLHQFHGTGTTPQNYTGSQEIFSTATAGFTVSWNATRSWWEVTVPVNGFSGFYLTSAKLAPVPIKLEYFTGSQVGKKHVLNWKASCISTDARFSIERSTDAINYAVIGNINATQLRCDQPFDYTDENPFIANNYYRINMIDLDGKSKYSNIVMLNQKSRPFEMVNLSPNIIERNNTVLKVNAVKKSELFIVITDNNGRTLQKRTSFLQSGINTIIINTAGLLPSVYQITGYTSGEDKQTLQFIKK